MYIPPTGSPYLKEYTLDIIQNEITQKIQPGKAILLVSDLNARTRCLPDYTVFDDDIIYIDNVDMETF